MLSVKGQPSKRKSLERVVVAEDTANFLSPENEFF